MLPGVRVQNFFIQMQSCMMQHAKSEPSGEYSVEVRTIYKQRILTSSLEAIQYFAQTEGPRGCGPRFLCTCEGLPGVKQYLLTAEEQHKDPSNGIIHVYISVDTQY